jgi:hypothetical protein
MWDIDLIQMQQYYEKQVTLRDITYESRRAKEGSSEGEYG